MDLLTILIILLIAVVQVYVFVHNLKRMNAFRHIFRATNSWMVRTDKTTGFVSGIAGQGNAIFDAVRNAINKYLANNKGAVIDFNLLKDAVDRHFDTVEDEIKTQTPIPIVCGLGGTMLGVIIGLSTFSVKNILQGGENNQAAIDNVDHLLGGVAIAMVTSICGIVLTLVGSVLFKRYKQQAERGKNDFLAWMQAELLPALPTDTSAALNQLVHNLREFNNQFGVNTRELGDTLAKVNESYSIQADIIETLHELDITKMAKSNVKVLVELQACTDKLEQFNTYLSSVQGYTRTIQEFNSQFRHETERLHVLEEIRDFFVAEFSQIEQRKAELNKNLVDVDLAFERTVKRLGEHMEQVVRELQNQVVSQSERLKQWFDEEQKQVVRQRGELSAAFSAQLEELPAVARQMEQIPALVDGVVTRMQEAHAELVAEQRQLMTEANWELMEMFGRQMQEVTARLGGGASGRIKEGGRTAWPWYVKCGGWAAVVFLGILAADTVMEWVQQICYALR